jgi:hypothetical protein
MAEISLLPTAVTTHNAPDSAGFVLDRSRSVPDVTGLPLSATVPVTDPGAPDPAHSTHSIEPSTHSLDPSHSLEPAARSLDSAAVAPGSASAAVDVDFAERLRRQESLRELEARITELAGHLNAATYHWLTLIAEFDRRQGWSDGGTHSCAHWLNWKCGIDMGAARERVRVAHALETLPRISAAMRDGQLSYSKVRALTRVAEPSTEEFLLQIALHGTAYHVEKLVRVYRSAKEAQELSREARQQERRGVMYFYDFDGSLVIKARLPTESGALFVKAMEAAVEGLEALEPPPPSRRPPSKASPEAHSPDRSPEGHASDVSAETRSARASPEWPPHVSAETSAPAPTEPEEDRPRLGHRRADALVSLAESYLAHGAGALASPERHQIVVHVDVQTLKDSTPGRCGLEDGPALAAETVRRLGCDASLVTVIESERGEPLSVGRKTRAIPTALRRALNARDRGCRFPGCPHTRYVDAHHIRHWAHGGETRPSNLVTLCRFHHRQVHEGRVVVEVLDGGALRFRRPDGESFDSVPPGHTRPPSDWRELLARHGRAGLAIDRDTAVTRWRGESMDYGTAIDCLLFRERRARELDGS